jgi:SAM-dependent methyltransferase
MTPEELNAELGNIDLFLLDQILKGRIRPDMKVLDAGCGEGRNLVYFLRNGYDVYALDKNPSAIQMVRMQARALKSELSPVNHFLKGDLTFLPFKKKYFQIVICSSVLHFADNRDVFEKMVNELLRVLGNDGVLLIKMDSILGIDDEVNSLRDGVYLTSDGSQRFLLNKEILLWLTNEKSLELLEPAQNLHIDKRSMALLVLKKVQ